MDQENQKTAIVTGAYGAIGFAIARKLAFLDYEVFLLGRNERRLEEAVATIQALKPDAKVWYELVDLSSLSSIKDLYKRWEGPLHILINNAATTPRERRTTNDGFELQFATNILGYFRMMHYFSEYMTGKKDARIVNVASSWAGDLDINDLQFEHRPYHNDLAYRQSKQANRMLTVAFAERLDNFGIAVNACHPRDVNSKLSNNLGYGGHESPETGAITPVWLATDPAGINYTGKYFENKQMVQCEFSKNKVAIEELYRYCRQFT
ncbi:MAG: retinol dehydrogenase [Bacteroidetes bacterium HGW-Bacteroidetes-17]|jgi:NAD(P)-dependent dehydrogenase (short-subunit alcohol dehydrogenase family)|nr:MAG: retinol dehydrogenase [Bacteroidetes bacterium HGW-Bacteroidetes-17]